MASEQEQPKRNRGRASGAKRSTSKEPTEADESQEKASDESDAGGAEQPRSRSRGSHKERAETSGQEASANEQPDPELTGSLASPDFGRLLQEQIAQAIQPMMQDFRQQLTTAVRQEVEQASAGDEGGATAESAQDEASSAAKAVETTTEQEQTDMDSKKGAPKQATPDQGGAPAGDDEPKAATSDDQSQDSSQHATASTQEPGEQATSEAAEPDEQETKERAGQSGVTGLVKGGLRPTLDSTRTLVERQAEHMIESALTAAVGAILAESTRDAVERAAEQGIRLAFQKTAGTLGNSSTVKEIQSQSESTLLAIVGEALDAVYADELRGELQQHAQRASSDLLHRNIGGALGHLNEALQMLLQEIVAVLRRQWHRLLRLLLKVILAALEDAPDQAEKGTSGKSRKRRDT